MLGDPAEGSRDPQRCTLRGQILDCTQDAAHPPGDFFEEVDPDLRNAPGERCERRAWPYERARRFDGDRRDGITLARRQRDGTVTIPGTDEPNEHLRPFRVDLPKLQVADLDERHMIGRLPLCAENLFRLELPRLTRRQQVTP